MSENPEPLLVQLQEAWQKHQSMQTHILRTLIETIATETNRVITKIDGEGCSYKHRKTYREVTLLDLGGHKFISKLKSLLSEGSSQESSFGVLLQRLITELPQQAKTAWDIRCEVERAYDYHFPQTRKFREQTPDKLWVALEALVCEGKNPQEGSKGQQQEQKHKEECQCSVCTTARDLGYKNISKVEGFPVYSREKNSKTKISKDKDGNVVVEL